MFVPCARAYRNVVAENMVTRRSKKCNILVKGCLKLGISLQGFVTCSDTRCCLSFLFSKAAFNGSQDSGMMLLNEWIGIFCSNSSEMANQAWCRLTCSSVWVSDGCLGTQVVGNAHCFKRQGKQKEQGGRASEVEKMHLQGSASLKAKQNPWLSYFEAAGSDCKTWSRANGNHLLCPAHH